MLDVIRPQRISSVAKPSPVAAGKMEKSNDNDQQKKRQPEKEEEDARVGVNIDELC